MNRSTPSKTRIKNRIYLILIIILVEIVVILFFNITFSENSDLDDVVTQRNYWGWGDGYIGRNETHQPNNILDEEELLENETNQPEEEEKEIKKEGYPRNLYFWEMKFNTVDFQEHRLDASPLEEDFTCSPPIFESYGEIYPEWLKMREELYGYDFDDRKAWGEFLENGELLITCNSDLSPAISYKNENWEELNYIGMTHRQNVPLHVEKVFIRCNNLSTVVVRARPWGGRPATKNDKPHILIVQLEAISRYAFARSMPLTRNFFADRSSSSGPFKNKKNKKKNKYRVFNFTNTNTNGINTPPNKKALFFGIDPPIRGGNEYSQSIWSHLQNQHDYISMYGENTCPRSFTDYITNPKWNYHFPIDVLCRFKDIFSRGPKNEPINTHPSPEYLIPRRCNSNGTDSPYGYMGALVCSGFRYSGSYIFDYYADFRRQIGKVSKYIPTIGTISLNEMHEDPAIPFITDKHIAMNLEKLETSGLLKNTILILLSDHGFHYGILGFSPRGKIERPGFLLNMLIPTEYLEKFPGMEGNLTKNQKRLVTHLDLFETFRHIPDYPSPPQHREHGKGVSLLSELVPKERDCKSAGIDGTSCFCSSWINLNVENNRSLVLSRGFAKKALEWMNSQIGLENRDVCKILKLNTIVSAMQMGEVIKVNFDVFSTRSENPQFEVIGKYNVGGKGIDVISAVQTTTFAHHIKNCSSILEERGVSGHFCDCK